MYEYKVLSLTVRQCEDQFNQFGREGWRLVRLLQNLTRGGVTAVLEREVPQPAKKADIE